MAGIDVYRTEIRQLNVELPTCSPTTFVVELEQTHFVHPHFTALLAVREVAHTDYHRLYLAQCWITHHADTVGRTFIVVHRELLIIACRSVSASLVALLLHICEHRNRHIEHIFYWPNRLTVLSRILVVLLFGRQFQRYFVFIVVVLVVGTQTNKHRQLIVGKVGNVRFERIGVHKHLQTLVLANIERSVFINRFRFLVAQIVHRHCQRLFVALHKLWL